MNVPLDSQAAAAADAAADDDAAGPIGAQWASQNGMADSSGAASASAAGTSSGADGGVQWEYRGQDGAVRATASSLTKPAF